MSLICSNVYDSALRTICPDKYDSHHTITIPWSQKFLDMHLQLQTTKYVRQGYTFRRSKAYKFKKIAITKCEPFDYVIAETCRGYLIANPHNQL